MVRLNPQRCHDSRKRADNKRCVDNGIVIDNAAVNGQRWILRLVTLLEILLCGAALLVLLPATVLFAEVVSAVTGSRGTATPESERRRLAVLVPAHNEASIIAGTLRSIAQQLEEPDRLIVVADNCSDETAVIAASEGAEVIARTDLNNRGKGYALDFGIRHLESDPPSIVVVIDADCRITAASIDRLARCCAWTARPVQALYLMRAAKDTGLMARIAEFAWVVKNQIRPMGLYRLGLPCQLMGTGMAFPWACICSARLATGHIVEDLKLGIDLTRAGTAPVFCAEAVVTSEFPVSKEGIRGQRERWEHGHLGVILSEAPRLLLESLASSNVRLMALALDLSVPPLALLALQVVLVWLASAAFFVVTTAHLPLDMTSAAAILLVLSVLMCWMRYGRPIISLGSLGLAVVYALWKIPLYMKFLVARQSRWVRSKRDEDGR